MVCIKENGLYSDPWGSLKVLVPAAIRLTATCSLNPGVLHCRTLPSDMRRFPAVTWSFRFHDGSIESIAPTVQGRLKRLAPGPLIAPSTLRAPARIVEGLVSFSATQKKKLTLSPLR